MNRNEIVKRHSPIRKKIEWLSPLTVGNGSIAYTADITGLQTLYEEQLQAGFPLLTMSDWGWHTSPARNGNIYELNRDLTMTEFSTKRGIVKYPVKKQPGNEYAYDWLRQNPHRYNLFHLGFIYQGNPISSQQLNDMEQYLDLYSGILYSQFTLAGEKVSVKTMCHQGQDILGFEINSSLLVHGDLQFILRFPYGSPDISGSDWNSVDRHTTRFTEKDKHTCCIEHLMDKDRSCLRIYSESESNFNILSCNRHQYLFSLTGNEICSFTISIAEKAENLFAKTVVECEQSSSCKWQDFWEKGAFISFEGSTDPRAQELERRIVLSLYNSAINSCTSMPPQETGLTINSWYGKAHLEMYLWHLAYLPLWGRCDLLKKSLSWFKKILPDAIYNAKKNHYRGAKWPKMVGPEGIDSPSEIAPLLIWQQPHLIFMLELIYQSEKNLVFLEEYWEIIKETADYMADLVEYNESKDTYELTPPVIPVQETHKPEETLNPVFELEYWSFGLKLAIIQAERLNKSYPDCWKTVLEHIAKPTIQDGVYLAHELCKTSYTEYTKDHPSVVAAFGLLPGANILPEIMRNTLNKIYEVWDFQSMWGWDFAMMAMTETRLGNPEHAINILMYNTPKNQYMTNGHNLQACRTDLPLYLPGNGSLLLAIPLMVMGYPGCPNKYPGFPDNESWKIESEGMIGFPY